MHQVIVKSGDDCRQEHLAVQLVGHFYGKHWASNWSATGIIVELECIGICWSPWMMGDCQGHICSCWVSSLLRIVARLSCCCWLKCSFKWIYPPHYVKRLWSCLCIHLHILVNRIVSFTFHLNLFCRYFPGSWSSSLAAAIRSACHIFSHCIDRNHLWYGQYPF